ncbi:unnamed protein product [Vitrella brassicaformis CCMP3155]|uniref:Spermatogenesis-associated protein 20-like TRX domain-containing protein n=1 Tax=Vitrella brassicaformis (strain CCMP3155) TaxID=1169540 RepID=A0A0G4GX53_VITBC|nr:unnamed protein product [Vitrella brassicaformis CCMP3155]|eukprot:CEM35642.1 unnamed protein product [Vitrella brassicaformis CCMP3155]
MAGGVIRSLLVGHLLFSSLIFISDSSGLGAAAVKAPIPRETDHEEFKYTYSKAEALKGRMPWMDYRASTFAAAAASPRPIFLLLTAPAWCYWCEVYESEDYLFHPMVADTLAQHFHLVYVDADKRADLTKQWLEGGWPSSVILLPPRSDEGGGGVPRRVYGWSGPRPPEQIRGILLKAIDVFERMRHEGQAANDVTTAGNWRQRYVDGHPGDKRPSLEQLEQALTAAAARPLSLPTHAALQAFHERYTSSIPPLFDGQWGGFGNGAKFPHALSVDYSVDMFERVGGRWADVAVGTLMGMYTTMEQMTQGKYNLWDPVEGGFHRYGTTRQWTPPHYEKMLVDNVKMLRTFAHLQHVLAPIKDGLPTSSIPPILNATSPRDAIDAVRSTLDDVVTRTMAFITERWWDSTAGGFFGSMDVNGEDAYYAHTERPSEALPAPRVDPTKYADGNGEAVITMAWLCRHSADMELRQVGCEKALDTLAFIDGDLMTDRGVYHFYAGGRAGGTRGNLADTSAVLLGAIQTLEALESVCGDHPPADLHICTRFQREKPSLLSLIDRLAHVLLSRNYDPLFGGFIDRNPHDADISLFASPGDAISLHKTIEDNGMAAYSCVRLALYHMGGWLGGEEGGVPMWAECLEAGLMTLGLFQESKTYLDDGYYLAKSAQLVLENDLIQTYESVLETTSSISPLMTPSSHWMTSLLLDGRRQPDSVSSPLASPPFERRDTGRRGDGLFYGVHWLIHVLVSVAGAFAAGLFGSVSTCSGSLIVPSMAAVAGMVRIARCSRRVEVWWARYCWPEVLGVSLLFASMGMAYVGAKLTTEPIQANIVDETLALQSEIRLKVAGVLYLVWATLLSLPGLYGTAAYVARRTGRQDLSDLFVLSSMQFDTVVVDTAAGAVLGGLATSLTWTPCIGPFMALIQDTFPTHHSMMVPPPLSTHAAVSLLLVYFAGMALPFLAVATVVHRHVTLSEATHPPSGDHHTDGTEQSVMPSADPPGTQLRSRKPTLASEQDSAAGELKSQHGGDPSTREGSTCEAAQQEQDGDDQAENYTVVGWLLAGRLVPAFLVLASGIYYIAASSSPTLSPFVAKGQVLSWGGSWGVWCGWAERRLVQGVMGGR